MRVVELSRVGKLVGIGFGLACGLGGGALAMWGELWPRPDARPALIAGISLPFLLMGWLWWWSGRK